MIETAANHMPVIMYARDVSTARDEVLGSHIEVYNSSYDNVYDLMAARAKEISERVA